MTADDSPELRAAKAAVAWLDERPGFLEEVGKLLDGPVVVNETASREQQAPWPACMAPDGGECCPQYRALAAERDAAIARAERLEADCEAAAVAINEIRAERDALRVVAEAARKVGMFDSATLRLANALAALPPGLGQSEG